MEHFFVRPKEPTILADNDFYELLPTDLLFSLIGNTVHVVPGPIHVDRFNDALSRTLSVYPLAAGRIEKPASAHLPWKIRLTNSPVPVTVIDSYETQIFPTDAIVQNPLHFVQSVNTENIMNANPDDPLLRMTVTRFILLGQTAIGLSSSHGIGDGFTVLRFLRLLSQNYQGLDALDPVPCYEPLLNLNSISRMSDSLGLPPVLSPSKCQKDPAEGPSLAPVNLRFTATQLQSIRQGVLDELNRIGGSNLGISRPDVIIALLIHSLAQVDSPPVNNISILINHRGMGIIRDDAACNAMLWGFSEPIVQSHSKSPNYAILDITTQIRASLANIRNINNLSFRVALLAAFMKLPGSMERVREWVHPGPGHMIVNSMWRLDWTSAHFGYPNQTRFHHSNFCAPRYIKIFTPNPTLLPDGKTWEVRYGDAEVSFFLDEDVKERFMKILQNYARCLGMPGEVEFF